MGVFFKHCLVILPSKPGRLPGTAGEGLENGVEGSKKLGVGKGLRWDGGGEIKKAHRMFPVSLS